MPSEIMISVLMPARNAEQTIKSAIRSLLVSLPRESEILVFLDGCEDGTESKVRSFRSGRIRILKSEENVGVAEALNRLAAISRGKYLARLDADDISLPWRFWRYKSILSKVDLAFSTQVNFSRGKMLFVRQPLLLPLNNAEVRESLKISNVLVHSTVIMHKEAFQKLGGYTKVPAEDYNLWLRASHQGLSLVRSSIPKVLFRLHAGQLSKSPDWLLAHSLSKGYEETKAALGELDLQQPEIRPLQRLALRRQLRTGVNLKGFAVPNFFLSLGDSVLWRFGTVVITLTIASLFEIQDYALYASCALATTFFQALLEGAPKMLQAKVFSDVASVTKINRLSLLVLLASMPALTFGLFVITFSFTGSLDNFLLVAPFVLALPLIRKSTQLQQSLLADGAWRKLVFSRASAVVISLLILIPALVFYPSLAIGSFSLFTGEAIFILLARGASTKIDRFAESHKFNYLFAQRKYTEALETQFGLWVRSQMDRLLVVALASPKLIGLYLLTFTLSRTPTETMSAGAVRTLKSLELPLDKASTYVHLRKNSLLVQLLSLTLLTVFALCSRELSPLLPESWGVVARVIPTFMISAIPAILSASLFEFSFRQQSSSRRWSLYVVSFLMASMVATSLNLFGLQVAGYMLVIREVAMSAYWWRAAKIPKGTGLLVQTLSLTICGLLLSFLAH